jgi:CubicO group peptidase (beta-lactamase class C family)
MTSRRSWKLSSLALVAAVAAAALPACRNPQPPIKPAPSAPLPPGVADAAAVDAALTPYLEAFGKVRGERAALSGYVHVQQGDHVLFSRGYGWADKAAGTRPDADTSFRIGSTSKQFTATAIMLLAQDGKLDIDAPVKTYLPEYPGEGAALTLVQLLSHTGGLPEYLQFFTDEAALARPHTTAELMATFERKPLEFPPGSKWSYSNSGYIILGAIIERVSGLSYAEFMRTRVFEPAGLTRTTVGDADGLANRALGYAPGAAGLEPAMAIDMSVPGGAGAIRSTARDLARWHQVLAGDTLLTAASRARMTTAVMDDYGLGWFLSSSAGHAVIGHGGNIMGFNTGYERVPDLDLVVIAWSNNQGVNGDPLAKAALTAALGGTPTPIVEHAAAPIDVAAAERQVGSYALDDASRAAAAALGLDAATIASFATLTIALDRTDVAAPVLTMKPAGQDLVPLDPVDATHYEFSSIGLALAFTLPATGPATGVTIKQGGLTLQYTRTP